MRTILRVLGYSTKCPRAELTVLFGLGCAAVGIGYGKLPVAAGDFSIRLRAISLTAACFAIHNTRVGVHRIF
jgi:hypothetical protein